MLRWNSDGSINRAGRASLIGRTWLGGFAHFPRLRAYSPQTTMRPRTSPAHCLEARIPVPERVAILGVNNDDLMCESAWPPLSSIDAGYDRVGYAAARLLDRLMGGEDVPAEQRIVRLPPLGVVRRASTDLLAVDDPNVADALRYIREHACDPCTVEEVLRHVPVGRRWLEQQFVQRLSRTPHEEIIRVRMEIAQRLLGEPEMTNSNVARQCGFSTVQSFIRAFHQCVGTTPGAFRRDRIRTVQ